MLLHFIILVVYFSGNGRPSSFKYRTCDAGTLTSPFDQASLLSSKLYSLHSAYETRSKMSNSRRKYDSNNLKNSQISSQPLCECSMKEQMTKYESDISIGSMVQVDIPGLTKPQFGVVRWMGSVFNEVILGIELVSVSSCISFIVRFIFHEVINSFAGGTVFSGYGRKFR